MCKNSWTMMVPVINAFVVLAVLGVIVRVKLVGTRDRSRWLRRACACWIGSSAIGLGAEALFLSGQGTGALLGPALFWSGLIVVSAATYFYSPRIAVYLDRIVADENAWKRTSITAMALSMAATGFSCSVWLQSLGVFLKHESHVKLSQHLPLATALFAPGTVPFSLAFTAGTLLAEVGLLGLLSLRPALVVATKSTASDA